MRKFFNVFILFGFLLPCCTSPEKSFPASINFTDLKTNTNVSLRGLFVVDENVIWVSGSNGTVLLSTDGGSNWKTCQIQGAEENDFRSIHAWDKNKALVFGIAGPDFGFLTEDSGNSWEVVFRDTTRGLFFNSLKFVNENIGLAISDPINGKPFLIKTMDAGKFWKQVQNIPNAVEDEANFAASNTCIEISPSGKAWIATGGKTARVFYSNDFGENWEVAETPIISGNPSSGIFSICFRNDLEGVIVGGTYNQPELNDKITAFTTDGGRTWSLSEIAPKEFRSCVQFISSGNRNFFLAIGKTGCDVSTDNGKTWNFISDKGFYSFRSVQGKLSGFVAGNEGRIASIEIED